MSFLCNLKSKIQRHFKNKSLNTHYFKDFSKTTYNSRTVQEIQEPLATLVFFFSFFYTQKKKIEKQYFFFTIFAV